MLSLVKESPVGLTGRSRGWSRRGWRHAARGVTRLELRRPHTRTARPSLQGEVEPERLVERAQELPGHHADPTTDSLDRDRPDPLGLGLGILLPAVLSDERLGSGGGALVDRSAAQARVLDGRWVVGHV